MPAQKFTARWVQSVKPPTDTDRIDYFDYAHFSKGQGLVLRVRRSGTKSWCVVYTRNGKNRPPFTIGRFPDLSLADAAETGARVLAQLLDGVDPGEDRNRRAAVPTFKTLADQFMSEYADGLSSGHKYRQTLVREFLPTMADIRIDQHALLRRGGRAILKAKAAQYPTAANRAHACIRKLGNWAVQEDLMSANPWANLPRPGGKERARDTVLTNDEIRVLWPTIESAAMAEPIKLMLFLILATAQRTAELRKARWSEFDLGTGWWTIPGEHTKNAQSHRAPLSPLALKLLKRARKLSPGSPWVFPSPATGKPVVESAVPRAVANNREHFPLNHWVPHDLRRSAASHMASLGVPRLVIKKILNHADNDVTSIYDRYSYAEEKRAALDTWGQHLQRLVGGAL